MRSRYLLVIPIVCINFFLSGCSQGWNSQQYEDSDVGFVVDLPGEWIREERSYPFDISFVEPAKAEVEFPARVAVQAERIAPFSFDEAIEVLKEGDRKRYTSLDDFQESRNEYGVRMVIERFFEEVEGSSLDIVHNERYYEVPDYLVHVSFQHQEGMEMQYDFLLGRVTESLRIADE